MNSKMIWMMIVEQYKTHQNSDKSEIQRLWSNIVTSFLKYSETITLADNSLLVKNIDHNEFVIVTDVESNISTFALEKNLYDYLKMFRLQVGILITKNIKIFYYENFDEGCAKYEMTLEFKSENKRGYEFIDLIECKSFNLENIERYIEKDNKLSKTLDEIRNKITFENIKAALIEYFKPDFDSKLIGEVINSMDISINEIKPIQKLKFDSINDLDEKILIAGGTKSGKYLKQKLVLRGLIREECNFTIAKLNKDSKRDQKRYWANPKIEFIHGDWLLVLNDIKNKTLYFFFIKANEIEPNQINTRVLNGKTLIDLEILNNEMNFEEIRTKLNFNRWLCGKTNY